MSFEDVRDFQTSLWALGIAGSDCAVYRSDACVYRYCSGWADIAEERPIDRDTIFQMYSMTKPVTCAAILKLMERGVLRLNDAVADFLPEYGRLRVRDGLGGIVPCRGVMTIQHLMSMTSGIPYDLDAPSLEALKAKAPDYSTREHASAVAEIPLAFEPGNGWLYGWSHDVLAAIAEVATGVSYGALLKELIFDPLDMREVYFRVPDGQLRRMARRYVWKRGTPPSERLPLDIPYQSGRHESGGAGLQCTVDEYARFALALCRAAAGRDNPLIRPESAALMRRNQLVTPAQVKDFRAFKPTGSGYGLGVFTDAADSGGPFGWGGAAGTYLHIDPANGLVVILALQAEPNPRDPVRPAMLSRIYRALGLEWQQYWI